MLCCRARGLEKSVSKTFSKGNILFLFSGKSLSIFFILTCNIFFLLIELAILNFGKILDVVIMQAGFYCNYLLFHNSLLNTHMNAYIHMHTHA